MKVIKKAYNNVSRRELGSEMNIKNIKIIQP